jgi:hypothetical protein
VQEPAKIFQGVGNALKKVGAPLEEATEAVGAERLEDADVNIGVVVLEKGVAVDVGVLRDAVEIVIEKLLAKLRREIGFCVEEERSEIVLKRAFATALIVKKMGLALLQHNVAGLEVAVEEEVAVGGEKKPGEAFEIVFERLFVETDASEAEKIVFEIVEVPNDGLTVKAAARIADGVVEVAASFDLETRKSLDDFAIRVDNGRGNGRAGTVLCEEMKESGVAKVFFEVGALINGVAVDFGNGKAMAAEVAGKLEERDILFALIVENADGGKAPAGETDNLTAGTAEFALKRENTLGGLVKMGLEEPF